MKKFVVTMACILCAVATIPTLMSNDAAKAAMGVEYDNIMVHVGDDATELYFNWVTYEPVENTVVQITESDNYKNGQFSTENAVTVTGESFNTGIGRVDNGRNYFVYKHTATVTGLKYNAEYAYRVGDGEYWSGVYNYKTPDKNAYNVLVTSDLHMYESYHPIEDAGADWQENITNITARHAFSHQISLGDQMQDANRVDFIDHLLNPEELRSISTSFVNGNHDVTPNHLYQKYYYNYPNYAVSGDDNYTGVGIEDYYYLYGRTLFVMLNFEPTSLGWKTNLGHWEKTFADAAEKYEGKYDWIVTGFHEPVYGAGSSMLSDRGLAEYNKDATFAGEYDRHKSAIDTFDRYGVDLVLFGHTHRYSRSYFMEGGVAQVNDETLLDGVKQYIDPVGIPYVNCSTSNTLSGDQNELYGRSGYSERPWLFNELTTAPRENPNVNGWGNSTYIMLEFFDKSLKLTTYDVDNPDIIYDQFVLTKSDIVIDNTPDVPEIPDNPEPPTTNGGCGASVSVGGVLTLLPLAIIGFAKKRG